MSDYKGAALMLPALPKAEELLGDKGPMRRIRSGCCARAARGHAVAAPPRSVMNSRRFMSDPQGLETAS
jgi:hypothetical protein